MAPPSFSVDVASAGSWTTATMTAAPVMAAATAAATAAAAAAVASSSTAANNSGDRWLCLFEGAVPHVAAFLGVPEHLALAAACRSLYHAWPQMAGLRTLAVFLDRSALSSPPAEEKDAMKATMATAPGSSHTRNNENRNPNPPHPTHPQQQQQQQRRPRGHSGAGGQQYARPWNSLSRLLRHWAPHVETLRFSGVVAGPVEDCLKEALGPALATPILLPAPVMSSSNNNSSGGGGGGGGGGKRPLPTPAMTRLKTLALPRVGLFPCHAAAVAAFLVGPGGARLQALDLSHNAGLRDEGAVAIFRAVAQAAERAAAADARAQAAAAAANNGRAVWLRRRRASSEPTHRLPALRRLDLSHTQLTAVGLRAVFHALGKGGMPRLEVLLVGGNPLKDEGGAALAAMIEAGALPRLQLLDATACGLGPAAMRRLAEAMAGGAAGDGQHGGGLPALGSLLVGANYIDSQAAGALALAIRAGRLPRLTHLRLDLSGEGPAALLLEVLGQAAGGAPASAGSTWARTRRSPGPPGGAPSSLLPQACSCSTTTTTTSSRPRHSPRPRWPGWRS